MILHDADAAGNAMLAPFGWTFRVDVTPPSFVRIVPPAYVKQVRPLISVAVSDEFGEVDEGTFLMKLDRGIIGEGPGGQSSSPDFLRMGPLSSAVATKVNCDLQLTLIASSLYPLLGSALGHGYERAKSRRIFCDLVDVSAMVDILIRASDGRRRGPVVPGTSGAAGACGS